MEMATANTDEPIVPKKVGGIGFEMLLGLLLFGILTVTSVVILFSLSILREQVIRILPEYSVFSIDAAFRGVLLSQAGILFVCALVLLGAVYVVLGRLVARPLRTLAKAMDTYVATGEQGHFEELTAAPREIRSLQSLFVSFVTRVEEGHKRDVDISRMKSDFISTAAHQLRTPLTGIRWALEALEKEPLTEEQKVLVTSAVGKSKDLVTVVGTLLDISSIESGKYHYKFASVDMRQLAEELARDFSKLAQDRNVSLFFAGTEETSLIARADRERIKWVLNNLVENAIRYTPSGGSVQLSVDMGGGRVFTRVKDTGIGIPQADRSNIFERFYRAGNAVVKENAGNGLGLYIARSIATDHGGDLGFEENEGGVGTTFTLTLPTA